MPRRVTLFLAILTAAAATLVTGSPAVADAALREASVRDGAVLTEPPGQVTFTFNEKLQERFTTVQVTASGGSAVDADDPVTKGATVTQRLPQTLTAGEYTVAYRIVSADGHPVSGKLSFRLQPPPTSTPPSPATTAVVPTASATAAVSSPAEDEGGSGTWLWIIAGVVVVAVGGVLLVGRRPRAQAGS